MDALEKSHQEIITEIKPLKEIVAAGSGLQKWAAFLTVAFSLAAAVIHMIHH